MIKTLNDQYSGKHMPKKDSNKPCSDRKEIVWTLISNNTLIKDVLCISI